MIACLFRRFELQLYDTVRERDIDVRRDCFLGQPSPASRGVHVSAAAATVAEGGKGEI